MTGCCGVSDSWRGGDGIRGTGGTEVSGEARERGVEEWRLWAALPPLGAAPRAP